MLSDPAASFPSPRFTSPDRAARRESSFLQANAVVILAWAATTLAAHAATYQWDAQWDASVSGESLLYVGSPR